MSVARLRPWLAGVAAGSLMAAGGFIGAANAQAPVTAQLWTSMTGPDLTALQSMVAAFNRSHHGMTIEAQFIAQSDQMLAKLSAAVHTNTQPTLEMGEPPNDGPVLLQSGKLLVLNHLMASVNRLIYPGLLKAQYYKGKEFAIPFNAGDYALFYNKADFRAAHIASPPTTWTQVIQDAKKLTDPAKHRYGIYVPFGTSEWTVWTFEGMLWSAGGQFLNRNDTKALFDSPQGVRALNIWRDLLYRYHAAPLTSFAVAGNSDGLPAFASNAVAMLIDGPWDLATFNSDHIDYGVSLFPKITQYADNAGLGDIYVFKTTTAEDNAGIAFVKWLMQPSNLAKFYYMSGEQPSTEPAAAALPLYKKMLAKTPHLSVFASELRYARIRPTLVSYPAISAALGVQLEKVLLNQEPTAQALAIAAREADQILRKNHE